MKRLQFVQKVWQNMLTNGGIEKVLLDKLRVVRVEPDKVVAEITVDHKHTNRLGIVHGGVVSTLVDVGGSLACAAHGLFLTGVTTDLNTTFLASCGKPGDRVEVHAEMQRLGRTMAYTFVEIREPTSQSVLARGSHTKYIASALKSKDNDFDLENGGR